MQFDKLDSLRLVEEQADGLLAGMRGPPTWPLLSQQRGFNREFLVFRSYFDARDRLQIYPMMRIICRNRRYTINYPFSHKLSPNFCFAVTFCGAKIHGS